eukprot:1956-Heterococcus_DN1.PRE.2
MQLNTFVLQKAAEHNQIAVVQYLRRQGCPWDANACTAAAVCARYNTCTYIDELQTLHWLHENGCPWNIAEHGGELDAAELTEMLHAAGRWSNIRAAK